MFSIIRYNLKFSHKLEVIYGYWHGHISTIIDNIIMNSSTNIRILYKGGTILSHNTGFGDG